ncbi:MAG: hypothetical protein HONBIEJF_01626 [Fimbriimonadaceae bacterium]|nr:hypothetical protein [Fimbriimonadaceae bacterium]
MEQRTPITVQIATLTFADGHRLSQIISAAGYQIVGTSSSLKEAIAIQIEHRPTVAIIDASLSTTPGVDVIQALRQVDPDCWIVVSLAPMQLHFQTPAIVAGANELLYRPYTAAKVVRAIQGSDQPRAA